MSKKYHLTPDQVAFSHLINSAFAGIIFSIELLEKPPEGVKKINKKDALKVIKNTLSQTNQALVSEYIRGELVKEGILEDGGDELCTFDPTPENTKEETIVYTRDELLSIRAEKLKPTWDNKVEGK